MLYKMTYECYNECYIKFEHPSLSRFQIRYQISLIFIACVRKILALRGESGVGG